MDMDSRELVPHPPVSSIAYLAHHAHLSLQPPLPAIISIQYSLVPKSDFQFAMWGSLRSCVCTIHVQQLNPKSSPLSRKGSTQQFQPSIAQLRPWTHHPKILPRRPRLNRQPKQTITANFEGDMKELSVTMLQDISCCSSPKHTC